MSTQEADAFVLALHRAFEEAAEEMDTQEVPLVDVEELAE